MPEPENTFWRAAAAVARGRGVVTDLRYDVTDRSFGPPQYSRVTRREVRVTVEIMLQSTDDLTRESRAPLVRLEEIVQRAGISDNAAPISNEMSVVSGAVPPRDETLEAIRDAVSPEPPRYVMHDGWCNVSRNRPRTPGMNGCSCGPVPGSGEPAHEPPSLPPPPPPPIPEPPKAEEPPDSTTTRFSLLELT